MREMGKTSGGHWYHFRMGKRCNFKDPDIAGTLSTIDYIFVVVPTKKLQKCPLWLQTLHRLFYLSVQCRIPMWEIKSAHSKETRQINTNFKIKQNQKEQRLGIQHLLFCAQHRSWLGIESTRGNATYTATTFQKGNKWL